MPVQLIYRRPHTRRLKSGGQIAIAGSWMIREQRIKSHTVKQFRHVCPVCGACVRSVRMPNGGWGHFEGAGGLHSVRHPCFYLGEDIGRHRDSETPDLFKDFRRG